METIELIDIGPVRNLSIPIRPGVVILRGANDSGKSLSLDAIGRLGGSSATVTCRDKVASGSVEGLGVKISVRQAARRSGELEAVSFEGDLSAIAELVDPKIKDPVAADRQRIKALLRLTETSTSVAMFSGIVKDPERFKSICTPDLMRCDDIVEMAAKLKRNLEEASRLESKQAEILDSQASACKQAADGIDLNIETDPNLLQAALEDAIHEHGAILSESRTAKETINRAELAKQRMATTPEPSVDAATELLHHAADCKATWMEEVGRLQNLLDQAKASLKEATADQYAKQICLDLERIHAESFNGWKEAIETASSVKCPTNAELSAADAKVTNCRKAIEAAAVVRNAKDQAAKSKTLREQAKSRQKIADGLRDSAKATDEVLSSAVASKSLTVKSGRLVTQQPERGEVFYAERSDGTRWKIAIDEAINHIRQRGAEKTALIPIPQVAWSELQPMNRKLIDEYAKSLGVCIVTAEATDDEVIHADAFDQT
jgi:hypothetical protein